MLMLCKVEFKTLLDCISIAENTMKTSLSDKMGLYKDIVAIIQFLSYLFHRGLSAGLSERLKSRPSRKLEKNQVNDKGSRTSHDIRVLIVIELQYYNTLQYKNKKQNCIQMKVRTKYKIQNEDYLRF